MDGVSQTSPMIVLPLDIVDIAVLTNPPQTLLIPCSTSKFRPVFVLSFSAVGRYVGEPNSTEGDLKATCVIWKVAGNLPKLNLSQLKLPEPLLMVRLKGSRNSQFLELVRFIGNLNGTYYLAGRATHKLVAVESAFMADKIILFQTKTLLANRFNLNPSSSWVAAVPHPFTPETSINSSQAMPYPISCDGVTSLPLTSKSRALKGSKAKSNETWIDTPEAMLSFLPLLSKYQKEIPDGAFDLKGVNVSRKGKVTHVLLTIKSQESHTWIIDVQVLGTQVLDMKGPDTPSLREILEDPERISLWFDLRNNADSLFHHEDKVSIRKGHPRDVQLMELVTRLGSRQNVESLKVCMQQEGINFMSRDQLKNWLKTTQSGWNYLFVYGWMVLEQRPLPERTKRYIAGDTRYLFDLHDIYAAKMPDIERQLNLKSGELMRIVDELSMQRAIESEAPDYLLRASQIDLAPPAILKLEEMDPWGLHSIYFPDPEVEFQSCGITAAFGTLFGAFKNLFN